MVVNISRFEHVAFHLKPTICRLFLFHYALVLDLLDKSSWVKAKLSMFCTNPRMWLITNTCCVVNDLYLTGHNKMVQQTSWYAIYMYILTFRHEDIVSVVIVLIFK